MTGDAGKTTVYKIRDGRLVVHLDRSYEPGSILEILKQLRDDPDYTDPLPMIVDYRQVEKVGNVDIVRETTEKLAHFSGVVFTKMAMLVSSELQFGVFRMASAYTDIVGIDMAVFKNEEDALVWTRQKTPTR